MLVLSFIGYDICWIQSLLLLTRTFIVGSEWQRESCVTAVLWTAGVYIATSKLSGCIEVPVKLVPVVKCQEHEIDHFAICLNGIVFAQGQFAVSMWNDHRASYIFLFLLCEGYKLHAFDWLIGPNSKINVKAIVDDCVISPKYSMPEMIYLYMYMLYGRKGVLNVRGVDYAGVNP